MVEFTKPNEEVPNNITMDRRSKSFDGVWRSRLVDKSNRQVELTKLPADLKRVAQINFAEDKQWKVLIFIGESPTKHFINDSFLPSGLLRQQKEESKISEYINLFNLPKFGSFFNLIDENSALSFKINGEYNGRIQMPNIKETLITQTTKDKDTVLISVGGPWVKHVRYYFDGRNDFMDYTITGEWTPTATNSYMQLLQKEGKFLDESDRYCIVQGIFDVLTDRKGCMVIVGDENEMLSKNLIGKVARPQPYKGEYIRDIPPANLLKLMEADKAVLISNEGKLISNGSHIIISPTREATTDLGSDYGSKHDTFESLMNIGCTVFIVSQQTGITPEPSTLQEFKGLKRNSE